MWEWTEEENLLAAGEVPTNLRWPIPVVCRGTNLQHQKAIRLMKPQHILDFVRHELCGEKWSEAGLEKALRSLYNNGGGTFDPISIIEGPSDLGDTDDVYGFADAPVSFEKPYSDIFPAVSSNRKTPGVVGQFLRWAEKHDKSAIPAEAMIRHVAALPLEMPKIEEEQDEKDEEAMTVDPITVSGCRPKPCWGKSKNPQATRKTRRRIDILALNFVQSIATSGMTRRVIAKRGKGASRSTFDVVILNSSGRPQLLAAMKVHLNVSVMINQEHHCRGADFADLQYAAKDLGWCLVGAEAFGTAKDGTSAGVAIAARAGARVGMVGRSFDHSPHTAPGRITAAWINVGPSTGMLLLSIYLYHTEGMSARNRGILQKTIALTRSYGSPWIIAGDFNAPPSFMMQHFGEILEEVDAYILAPSEPTHSSKLGTDHTLDYAICSSSVEPWVDSIAVDYGFLASPHKAVRMKLRARAANYLVDTFKRPKPFARHLPIGCARQPVLPVWHESPPVENLPDRPAGGHPGAHQECSSGAAGGHAAAYQNDGSADGRIGEHRNNLVDENWHALCHAMETELCRLHGCVTKEGLGAAASTGRSEGLVPMKRFALPMKASAEMGKVSIPVHALVWLETRVKELACISRKIERGHMITPAAARQWQSIMRKIAATRGLPAVIRKLGVEWEEKLESVRLHWPGTDTYTLERVYSIARSTADTMKSDYLEEKATSWKLFVDKQLSSGAASAHRLVKRDAVPCVDATTVGEAERRTASPQAVVNQDLEQWRNIWTRLGNTPTAPWRSYEARLESLPPLTAEDIRRAAKTFKTQTSLGCDSFSPKDLAALSVELRTCVATYLNEVEHTGRWPEKVATALIHLTPKPDGGRRPIGVLPTIVRVWERARKPIVQAWLDQNTRDYDWATRGRSAEGAAWHMSVLDEAAAANGLASGATFMDLAKAFEHVSLHHVWRAGVKHKFPLVVLRLVLEAFAFSRRLCYKGAVSEPIESLSAVLAGGGFAQVALLLTLIDPLDRVQATYTTGVTLCSYVDDIAVHVVGHPSVVAAVMAACTDDIITALEDDLDMKVSRRESWSSSGTAKTVAAVSCRVLERKVTTSMRRMGVAVARKAKHLGTIFGPGAKSKTGNAKSSRWAKIASKRARAIKLGRRLGRHVFTTGLKPAALYGSTVTSASLGTIRAMRKAAGRALGRGQGRSLSAKLAVHRCDPGWDAARNPIMAWTNQCWEKRVSQNAMQRAWMHARVTIAGSPKPHAAARGAAGVFCAALITVGWTTPAYNAVTTLDGTTLLLDDVAPKTVERHLFDDYQTMAASSSSCFQQAPSTCQGGPAGGHAGGHDNDTGVQYETIDDKVLPWFEPAAAVLNSAWAKSLNPATVASTAALPEGGWWTQEKLFEKGLAADPFCKLCNTKVGTLCHRLFFCPNRRERMEAECPASLRKHAIDETDNPLFTQGIPRRPHCPPPPPAAEQWIGVPPSDGAGACGEAYTDGALKGTAPKARRAGWAYVVDDGAAPMWGKFGTCSEAYTTVLRAELRALLEILRVAIGPIVIHVDNKQVVDGVQKGKTWCCGPKRDGADLWREIWRRLDDLEGLVEVRKVKAHLRFQDVVDQRIPWSSWVGNGVADMWAKFGSAEASRLSPAGWVQAEWNKACSYYRWAIRVASEWAVDTESTAAYQSQDQGQEVIRITSQRRDPRIFQATHELWRSQNRAWCRLCGIEAPWTREKCPAAYNRRCLGTMGSRCGVFGRERAKNPNPGSFDDGCISLATLRLRGAERVFHDPLAHPPSTNPSGTGGGHALVQDGAAAGLQSSATDYREEDDPFGYGALGVDDAEQPRGADLGDLAPPCPQETGVEQSQNKRAHPSHSLRRCAQVVWCGSCGRHAAARLGKGLLNPCRGIATGGYPSRIARLKAGRHPMTGEQLI